MTKPLRKMRPERGSQRAGNQFEQSGFAAGVGAEDGDDFAGLGLEAEGFEREERGLRGIGGVGVADLLDAEANVGVGTRLLRISGGV